MEGFVHPFYQTWRMRGSDLILIVERTPTSFMFEPLNCENIVKIKLVHRVKSRS